MLAVAAAAFVAAFVLLVAVGLPQRADFTGVRLNPNDVRLAAPEINAFAPPITQPLLDGSRVTWDNLRGRPVIVNFWATWCGPCRIEMPELQTLYDSATPGDLEILAVNLGESREAIQQWVDAFDLTYPIVQDRDGMIAAAYRLRGQPSTYVIDPEGVIRDIFFGPVDFDRLRAALAPYP